MKTTTDLIGAALIVGAIILICKHNPHTAYLPDMTVADDSEEEFGDVRSLGTGGAPNRRNDKLASIPGRLI